MEKTEMLKMRLDLFGETEGAGAGTAPEAAPAAEAAGQEAGVDAIPAREGRRELLFPAVPKQEVRKAARKAAPTGQNPTAARPAAQTPAETGTPEETFEELIHGKYKEQYGAAVQAAVQQRFRNQADLQQVVDAQRAILSNIAPMYGIAPDEQGNLDMAALKKAIEDDDRLYEKAAMEKGIPVSTEKYIRQLEAQQRQREMENRISLERELNRRHIEGLRRQEEELKREYPEFSLDEEAKNPDFVQMTRRGGGLTLKQAYQAIHGDELLRRQAQRTAERTKETVSRAIQSGSYRPQENGVAAQGGGAPRRDPAAMSREERAEVIRRAMAGEHVRL